MKIIVILFLPDQSINGVSFGIEEEDYKGTNLSPDSYISVEMISSKENSCNVQLFLNNVVYDGTVEELDNHIYAVASSSGAAAGNRYEETIYVTPINNSCFAIRYFIHYGLYENYPPESIREFDKQELLNKFDAIRKSIKYN
jgi:hypothetical protein